MNAELDIINVYAVYLKQLVINYSFVNFATFELLLEQTPNLKILTIDVEYQLDIVDAERWQHLISSSLHYLDIFNFKFSIMIDENCNYILNKFQQYQTDFWHKQHQWYTNYDLHSDSDIIFIYTIPYVWNEFI
jgi:hypothetical protein